MSVNRRILNKKFLIYAVAYLLVLVLFIWGITELLDFSGMVEGSSQEAALEFKETDIIIKNNMKNLLGYIVLFPIFPAVLFIDFFSMGMSVAMSLYIRGIAETMVLLIPHAIIEIPNFLLYTYLSRVSCKHFWKDGSGNKVKYWQRIRGYWKRYAVCGIVIIAAGIIEGVVTPLIYGKWL